MLVESYQQQRPQEEFELGLEARIETSFQWNPLMPVARYASRLQCCPLVCERADRRKM